ncbi:MAG: hypothetical protein ABWZ66_05635 [Pyrinomonadaceae bacterium]
MASRMVRENERNIRANDFLQENKAEFAANTYATTQIEALKTEITEGSDAREEQISSDGGARQYYEIAENANEELIEAMDDVIDFAVTMGEEIDGIEERFRRVRSGGKRGRIARARVIAADAVPYEAIFIGRGLDKDFIENLNNKADALEQALTNAVSQTGKRTGATGKKLLSTKNAGKIVKNLDPIVRKRYRDEPAKLAAWDYASRVRRSPQPPTNPTP